ncbi:MAG: hypothetical protein ACOYZ6_10210 [Chloroflexota bacterium]
MSSACVPENFINREKEIALVVNRVSDLAKGKPFDPKERVFHFVGPSGIGKSCLLKKLTVEQTAYIPILVQLDALKGGKRGFALELLVAIYEKICAPKSIKPEKYIEQTLSQFAKYVQRTITVNGKDHVTVLLLDEVNIPPKKDMQAIEEHLLVKFIHDNKLAVLVTAGRSQPAMLTDFALRPNPSNIFPLPVFDEEKTRRYMESLKPGSGKLAGKVVKLGSGVPGNTVKLAEHINGDPLDISNEALAIQSLLDDIKKTNNIEAQFHPMLEAISILQGFFPEDVAPLFQSHPQLGSGWDEGKVKEEFLRLKDIKVGPGGLVDWDRDKKYWAMDESTRDLFEKEFQMRDPKLWKKLHCTAMEIYREWGQKYNSDTYRNKSNYHQQRLQSAGMNCSDLEV